MAIQSAPAAARITPEVAIGRTWRWTFKVTDEADPANPVDIQWASATAKVYDAYGTGASAVFTATATVEPTGKALITVEISAAETATFTDNSSNPTKAKITRAAFIQIDAIEEGGTKSFALAYGDITLLRDLGASA